MGRVAYGASHQIFSVGFCAERARFVFGDVSAIINKQGGVSRLIAELTRVLCNRSCSGTVARKAASLPARVAE
jgi:hypothetical protein